MSEYRENLKKIIERQGDYDRILAGTDAHLAVHMLGEDLLSANAIGENELRLDGKPGNVLYSEEKAR